jgi:hypothetical protein
MNNTKWHKLLDRLNEIRTDKRVKYIDSEKVSNWQPGAWIPVAGYVEFSGGPTPFRFIEWLEIKKETDEFGKLAADRLRDRSKEIRDVLSSMKLDIEETSGSYIVYGYRRASQQGGAVDALTRATDL